MASIDITNAIVTTAQGMGLDPRLALEVAIQESGLDQNARGSSGEIGIFQLMPQTALQLGVDPTDPLQNIEGGVSYLASLIGQFGDVAAALAAYNWGQGNVAAAVAQYGAAWLAHAPGSVQNYVTRILGNVQSNYTASATISAAPAPGQPASSGSSWSTVVWVLALGLLALVALRGEEA